MESGGSFSQIAKNPTSKADRVFHSLERTQGELGA